MNRKEIRKNNFYEEELFPLPGEIEWLVTVLVIEALRNRSVVVLPSDVPPVVGSCPITVVLRQGLLEFVLLLSSSSLVAEERFLP